MPFVHRHLLIALALAGGVFVVDLMTPLGVALGVAYLGTLAVLLPSRVSWHAPAHAIVCTGLTLADLALGTPSAVPMTVAVVNRSISILAIWSFALLLARYQRNLREQERERERQLGLFLRVLEAAPDGMLLVGPDGAIRYANGEAARIFGATAKELQGRAWRERLRKGTREDPSAGWRVTRNDRAEVPVECRVSSLDDGEDAEIIAIRDVSEKQHYEERLRATQRMEAIGKLAGGIAHDFNNVLAAIVTYASLAKKDLPPGSQTASDIGEIEAAAERAAGLTRQLLAFSRRQIITPLRVDLNELVTQLQRMVTTMLGEGIRVETVLQRPLWTVKVDPGQLEQVLLNFAVNSREAMPSGGCLTIETANITLDDAYAADHPEVVAGDYVLLAVSDTGVGMTEDVRVRVFEPFFTTRSAGRGSGLGLATVYGIVKQAGGHVWVYSEPGRGTTFKVYLPRAEGDPQRLPERRSSPRPPGGTESLLVVEDEPAVRCAVVRTLRNAGYAVIEAANGADALRKLEVTAGRIDLLVTDVVMPIMGGRELAARIEERYPNTCVLYLSGYTENAIVHHGVLDPDLVFLQKPFSPDDLLRRVRDVLNASRR